MRKIYEWLAGVGTLCLALLAALFSAKKYGQSEEKLKQAEKGLEQAKEGEKIDETVRNMSDDDINRELSKHRRK